MRDGSFRYRTLDEERKVGRRLRLALWLKQAVSRLNPLRLLRGKEIQTESPAVTPVLLDVAHILEVLCSVHASELFAFGVFNADCHPGNVLLLEDGRIGLLDYGQVKRIEREHRVRYARLIVALAADDREAVVRLHFEELGVRTLRMSSSVAYLAAAFYHDRDSHDVTGGRDMVTFLEHIESLDPMVQLPEPYLLAMRGNMILRGVAKVMGVRLRMSHMWLAEAKQLLESEGVQGYY
jgi:aarF domain-containing kinase